MHFKIEASFIGESHDFLEDKSDCLDEKRIDERVYDFTMLVSWMLIKYYLVLDEEMGYIVVEVDISGDSVQPYQLPETINRESFILRIRLCN